MQDTSILNTCCSKRIKLSKSVYIISYIKLHYIIFYYFLFYHIILYYIILNYIILYYIRLDYFTLLYYIQKIKIIFKNIILYYIISYFIVLYYIILFYFILYDYYILYYIIFYIILLFYTYHIYMQFHRSIYPHRSVGWISITFHNLDDSHRTCHNSPWSSSGTKSGQLKAVALNSELLRVASVQFRSEEKKRKTHRAGHVDSW